MKYWRTVVVRHFTMKCFVESEIFGSRVKNVHDIITDNIPDDSVTILLKIFYISLAYIYI